MKCPLCGNEEFVEVGSFLKRATDVWGIDTNKYFGCTQCHLILTFNKQLINRAIDLESKPKGKEVN